MEDAVNRFLQRHAGKVMGVLSGFDRLVLRGTLRRLSYAVGMKGFLDGRHVLLKHFGDFAQEMTERLKRATVREAEEQGRPVRYLASSRIRKDEMAREIAARDGIEEGLVAVLRCIEPCMSYEIYRNRDTKRLELKPRERKCLHYYQYRIDPVFGFMGARIQTWFPFSIQITLNGREWLRRRLEARGVDFLRQGNKFLHIEDYAVAQRFLNRHRYHLTERGRKLTTALNAMLSASTEQLLDMAA